MFLCIHAIQVHLHVRWLITPGSSFLNQTRNSLMMKNERHMTDMNAQKAIEKSFFGKYMTSKTYFSNFYQDSVRFYLRICCSQDPCPRPLIYDGRQESRPIEAISQNI